MNFSAKHFRLVRFLKYLMCAILIFGGSMTLLQAVQYAITNLGEFGSPYLAFSRASAINSQGQVAGWATATNGDVDAFYYDGQLHDLGPGYAYGINDSGVVVGQNDDQLAFYNANHTTNGDVIIPPLGGGTYGNGVGGINNSGVIVGNSYIDNHTTQNPNAYEFQYPGGPPQDLGDILGSGDTTYYSFAAAINNSGIIAGTVEGTTYGGFYYPAIDSGNGFTTLPLLSGDIGGNAYAINSSDVVVGQSGNNDGNGPAHAVYWIGSSVFPIISFSTNNASQAYGINDSGQVVGYTETDAGTIHAFVCITNGVMTDLNTLIAAGKSGGFTYLYQATAINNNGLIVGYGYSTNGNQYAFLATPNSGTGTGPSIIMNQPIVTNRQVLLNFTVNNLNNATYHLLQTAQLQNAVWTTNTIAPFTTNILNSSYRFTDTNNATARFYRVQSP
jgi:probable HAF family extracellular repeat protein